MITIVILNALFIGYCLGRQLRAHKILHLREIENELASKTLSLNGFRNENAKLRMHLEILKEYKAAGDEWKLRYIALKTEKKS